MSVETYPRTATALVFVLFIESSLTQALAPAVLGSLHKVLVLGSAGQGPEQCSFHYPPGGCILSLFLSDGMLFVASTATS